MISRTEWQCRLFINVLLIFTDKGCQVYFVMFESNFKQLSDIPLLEYYLHTHVK